MDTDKVVVDIEEIDRNARAYGYEIGRGQPIAKTIETSEDNPFLDKDWKSKISGE